MNSKKGFTLVEIIISVGLIAIVMLFLFQLLTDVEFEAEHPTYAKENQVVRASVMRRVQQDLTSMSLERVSKSIHSEDAEITFYYRNGTDEVSKFLRLSKSEINYNNEEKWSIEGTDVFLDLAGISVVENDNADSSMCTSSENEHLKITEQHCPTYKYVKIVIPVENGNGENLIDDIELFYIGENKIFLPDYSSRTYRLRYYQTEGVSIEVNRRSTSQPEIASTGIINESNEIYPDDQLAISVSPLPNYVIDDLSVSGFPGFDKDHLSGDIVVRGDVDIEVHSHVPQYQLQVSEGTGSRLTITRTASTGGSSNVILKDGDTIYKGDVLKIEASPTITAAYNQPTIKVNGINHASGSTYTVNANISISSSTTVKEYTLTKSQGAGTTLIVQRNSSSIGGASGGNLENGAKIYYNDILKVSVSSTAGYKDAIIKVDGADLSNGGTKTVTGNMSVVSSASKITYTVSYNNNGGSGTIANQTKVYGETLALTSAKTSKEGHTFKNWNTASNGSGTSYNSGQSYTGNAALTLYAIYTPNTYTVSYNANGGQNAPGNQTKTYGVSLTLSGAKPTRSGYTFVNWNTASNGSGTSYNSGQSYTGNEPLTLYAQWKQNGEEITSSNISKYLGKYVNYNAGGRVYQIFYYDASGKYGVSKAVYLLATPNGSVVQAPSSDKWSSTKVYNLNPGLSGVGWNAAQGYVHWNYAAGLANPSNYTSYLNSTLASYAVGGPSIPMFVDAYNLYYSTNITYTWGGSGLCNGWDVSDGFGRDGNGLFYTSSLGKFLLSSGIAVSSTSDSGALPHHIAVVSGPTSYIDYARIISNNGSSINGPIRPLIQLKTTVRVNGGDGSQSNPYKLIIP